MEKLNLKQASILRLWMLSFFSFVLSTLYPQQKVSTLDKSNLSLAKEIQDAHYLLTAKLHNSSVQDYFLEVNPYDVSGNARHGMYVNVSIKEQEGNGLYYEASPPFYPVFSRNKVKTEFTRFANGKEYVGNPGKKFLEPDNNLVKSKVRSDGSAKSISLSKIFWDTNGDGVRNSYTIEELSKGKVNEKQLKFPYKSNISADTYFSFPQPFKNNVSGNFTVTFWLNPRTVNICSITMPIMDTQFFKIELVNGGIRFTHKEYGVAIHREAVSWDPPSSNIDDCQRTLNNKWRFYGLSFKKNLEDEYEITLLQEFKNENPIHSIYPETDPYYSNVIPKQKPSTQLSAKMMGSGFGGSLYSVRFINEAINKAGLIDIIETDYKILQGKTAKKSHLNSGFSYKNNLNFNTLNRFQHVKGARELNPDEKIKINSFLPKNYDATKGYSVSFWTKIDVDLTNDDDIPFDENLDTRYQFFYGKSNLDIYAGMQRVKDKLGVNRYYFDDKKQELSPIFAWLWEPGAFNSKAGCSLPPCEAKGWYHVVLVYYPSMMRVYLFHPNESDIYRRLLYLGAQNIASVEEWAIGSPPFLSEKYPYPVKSVKYIDDFKVYSWPLSLSDVKTLHKTEMDEAASVKLDNSLSFFNSPNTEHVANAALSAGQKAGIGVGTTAAAVTAIGGGVILYRYGLPRIRLNTGAGDSGENIRLLVKEKCE